MRPQSSLIQPIFAQAGVGNAFHLDLHKHKSDAMFGTMHYRTTMADDFSHVSQFLERNGLTAVGVGGCLENFIIAQNEDGSWIGVAGFENYGESCLLRSVAVDKPFRGQGYGQSLVKSVLANAKAKGIRTVYLLTEDASTFFEKTRLRDRRAKRRR
jgi:N-acetylglutamate synthase-like GNAT family acetyltransferase